MNKLIYYKNKSLFAEISCDLFFSDYWPAEIREKNVPFNTGIYVVHAARYNKNNNTVSEIYPLYIGSSTNLPRRISKQKQRTDFKKSLHRGKRLFFTFAECNHEQMERLEAALIFSLSPKVNEEYKKFFPFGITKVKTIESDGSSLNHKVGTNKRELFDQRIKDWRDLKKRQLNMK